MQSNKNFVHITGLNDKTMESFIGELKNMANKKPVKHFSNPIKVLLKNAASNMYRKLQKYAYRFYSQPEALEVQNKMRKQDSNASFGTVVSNCINILTGHKSKTFYVPGNEEFFNKNFMADIEYHFQKLTPINNADINVYEEAIDFVFHNPVFEVLNEYRELFNIA